MGFFNDLKKNLQDEVDKNAELKEALNKFKKDGDKQAEPEAKKGEDATKAAEEAINQAKENLAKVKNTIVFARVMRATHPLNRRI
jgi:hypothetical protein